MEHISHVDFIWLKFFIDIYSNPPFFFLLPLLRFFVRSLMIFFLISFLLLSFIFIISFFHFQLPFSFSRGVNVWIIGAETIESRRDRWQSSIDGRGQQQQQQQQQQQRTRRGRMGGVRCRSERKKRKAGKKCVKNRQLKNCAGGRFARVSRVQFSIEIQLRFFLSYDIYFFWVWIHPFFLVIPPPSYCCVWLWESVAGDFWVRGAPVGAPVHSTLQCKSSVESFWDDSLCPRSPFSWFGFDLWLNDLIDCLPNCGVWLGSVPPWNQFVWIGSTVNVNWLDSTG